MNQGAIGTRRPIPVVVVAIALMGALVTGSAFGPVTAPKQAKPCSWLSIAVIVGGLGGQRALVIGPTWYETPVSASVTRVSDDISKAADGGGVPYLDALHPPCLTTDQIHSTSALPTDKGQSVIAVKVAAWLRTEVAG